MSVVGTVDLGGEVAHADLPGLHAVAAIRAVAQEPAFYIER